MFIYEGATKISLKKVYHEKTMHISSKNLHSNKHLSNFTLTRTFGSSLVLVFWKPVIGFDKMEVEVEVLTDLMGI